MSRTGHLDTGQRLFDAITCVPCCSSLSSATHVDSILSIHRIVSATALNLEQGPLLRQCPFLPFSSPPPLLVVPPAWPLGLFPPQKPPLVLHLSHASHSHTHPHTPRSLSHPSSPVLARLRVGSDIKPFWNPPPQPPSRPTSLLRPSSSSHPHHLLRIAINKRLILPPSLLREAISSWFSCVLGTLLPTTLAIAIFNT